ncbi:MAG: hypothetical protein IPI54_03810 [Chitinophagaceae bacterium]|nr:hypothetical protein [Chitinophagaceae bacterium]
MEAGGYPFTHEETNISELISKCVQDFITRYPQQKIETAIAPDIFINGDRLLLQILANNLIDNAIKYGPKELPVTVILTEENDKIILRSRTLVKGSQTKKEININKFYWVGNALKPNPQKEEDWALPCKKK